MRETKVYLGADERKKRERLKEKMEKKREREKEKIEYQREREIRPRERLK